MLGWDRQSYDGSGGVKTEACNQEFFLCFSFVVFQTDPVLVFQ
jgi:hypothetical protein